MLALFQRVLPIFCSRLEPFRDDATLDLMELEPRVLCSASPIEGLSSVDPVVDVLAAMDQADLHTDVDSSWSGEFLQSTAWNEFQGQLESSEQQLDRIDQLIESLEVNVDELAESAVVADPSIEVARQVVFIDSGVEDWERLVAELGREHHDSVEVLVLSADRDGVEQISEALAIRQNVAAIHVVSHGNRGQLILGDSVVTEDNVIAYAGQMMDWKGALLDGADLLIYGCDLAAEDSGQRLLMTIGALCDCDVAASDDTTGSHAAGGDWTLEYSTGQIDHQSLFLASADLEWQHSLATYIVTSSADTNSVGTLRWAVNQANATGNFDSIEFNIAGGGVQRIMLTDQLELSRQVRIDGTTQNGYSVGAPMIEIDGSGITLPNANIFWITGRDVTIQGLSLINSRDDAIEIEADDARIVSNFIGLNANGVAEGNTYGMLVRGDDAVIGGTDIADRNVIAGNLMDGLDLSQSSERAIVLGNHIGTDFSGTLQRGNGGAGIRIRNNAEFNQFGGLGAGQANLIAYNGGAGVDVDGAGYGNSIRGNLIFGNVGLAIDLDGTGVSPNDYTVPIADADNGSNRLQNFPVISSATFDGVDLILQGDVSGRDFVDYEVDFYATTILHASGHGEAERYLGSATIRTDADGEVTFSTMLTTSINAGEFITATSTHADGSTSEFSSALAVSILPVNSAPVLDISSELLMQINRNQFDSMGMTVAQWLASGGIDPITDADGDPDGIAITGFSDSNGRWEASVDGGTVWVPLQDVPAPINANRAIVLDETARIRFVPNAGFIGTSGALRFRAWDQSDGLANGTLFVDTTPSGGTSPFSTAQESVRVEVVDTIDTVLDSYSITEDQTLSGVNVLSNDRFIGVGTGSLTVSSFQAASDLGGSFSVSLAGDLVYSPGGLFDVMAPGQTVTDRVRYTVTDGQGNSEIAVSEIVISGVNDLPVFNAQSLAVDENASIGTVVGLLTASDVDAGPSGDLTFSVVGGTGQSYFELAADGTVRVFDGSGLDFESTASFTLEVQVTDNAPVPGTRTQTITIGLNDINEAATLALTPIVTTIVDTSDLSTRVLVASLGVFDDALGSNNLSLVGADASQFELVGNQLFLRAGVSLDSTLQSELEVYVNLDDASLGANPDDQQVFRLGVTEGNEAPLVSVMAIDELPEDLNTLVPVKVGDIQITDDNLGFNQLSLSGPDAALFFINGTELLLRAGVVLDFETNDRLDVTVLVDDASVGGTPDDAYRVPIDVLDIAELPPGILVSINGSAETSETGGQAEIEVSLQARPLSNVVLAVLSSDESEGRLTASSLMFGPNNWNVPQAVMVTGQSDATIDGDQLFSVTIAFASGDGNFAGLFEELEVTNREQLLVLPTTPTAEVADSDSSEDSDDTENEDILATGVSRPVAIIAQVGDVSKESKSRAGHAVVHAGPKGAEADSDDHVDILLRVNQAAEISIVTRTISAGRWVESDPNSTVITTEDFSHIPREFYDDLDTLRESMTADANAPQVIVGSVATIASVLTAGYVSWLIPGGQILMGMLGQMPLWRFVDPLPILSSAADDEEDDDSLANMVDEAEKNASNPSGAPSFDASQSEPHQITETLAAGIHDAPSDSVVLDEVSGHVTISLPDVEESLLAANFADTEARS